jgi:phosphoribosylamine---glycine ligase
MTKIAILGGGGREHALADALQRDDDVTEVGTFIPNPGMQGLSKVHLFEQIQRIDPSTFVDIGRLLQWKGYDSAIVGPEQPLADGIVDVWREAGIDIPIFGPSREAAQLEGSKFFAREFMSQFDIPIPRFFVASSARPELAESDIRAAFNIGEKQIVLKADGLADGKWVEIHDNPEEAISALMEYFKGKYGKAGNTVLIEECIEGMEFSVFALVDGTGAYKILPVAQDHKRLFNENLGPNTGGMGAFAPFIHPGIDHEEMMRQVEDTIIKPTVSGIQERGLDYKWVIYFGLMQTADGPKVIEYNVRFGDPEAEVLIPLINTPFSHIVTAVTRGKLDELKIVVSSDSMVGVVLAAEWYPENPQKGAVISGLNHMSANGVQVFHAGTKQDPDGKIVVNGGRVLVITGRGKSLQDAKNIAQISADQILFNGRQLRYDIGDSVLYPKNNS